MEIAKIIHKNKLVGKMYHHKFIGLDGAEICAKTYTKKKIDSGTYLQQVGNTWRIKQHSYRKKSKKDMVIYKPCCWFEKWQGLEPQEFKIVASRRNITLKELKEFKELVDKHYSFIDSSKLESCFNKVVQR